jgi:predicted dehydrogenase
MHGVGIIGMGIMGRRMADAIAGHPAHQVAAAYDPKPPSETGGLRFVATALDLITDPAVDLVYIASPPASHLGLVRLAAQHKKPVFCEKPLSNSVAEARDCVDAVVESRVPAAVNFPFATSRAATELTELARSGALGEITSAHLTLRFARWPRGWQMDAASWLAGPGEGGFTREVMSHFLFLANRLFGTPVIESASLERGETGAETAVRAVIRYEALKLIVDAAVAGEVDDHNRFELIGTKDKAALTDWHRLDHKGEVSSRATALQTQLDDLAKLIEGETHRLATFAEAAGVVGIVEDLLST